MHGLYLLVRPDGARYWRMDYRHAGKRGTVALGIYPQVSLEEAREKRASARKLLDKGINPSAYKKLTRGVSAIGAGDTFNVVADEWLGKLEAEGRSPATRSEEHTSEIQSLLRLSYAGFCLKNNCTYYKRQSARFRY